jgi:hypothetical protein
MSTHGSLMTTVHDQLVDDWAGYGLVVDLENVKLRYMSGKEGNRLGMLRTNIQANDADGEEDEYLSELGLQLMLESATASSRASRNTLTHRPGPAP